MKQDKTIAKLPGFTIMELIVVMLLTSVTIGLAYFAYNISIQQFLRYKKKEGAITNQFTLHACLSRDMRNSEEVRVSSDGFELQNGNHLIRYVKIPDALIRETQIRDTFFTQDLEMQLLAKNLPANSGEQVDELILKYSFEDEQVLLDLHKDYGCKMPEDKR